MEFENLLPVKNNTEVINKKEYKSLVKHNKLIMGKYKLEASEQKLLYKVFEHIQKTGYTEREVNLTFKEFYNDFKSVLNKNITKKDFRKVLEGVQDKIPYIIGEDGEFVRTQWYKIKGDLSFDEVTLEISKEIFECVQGLEANFTELRYSSIYSFKRFSSMRLYEILRQWVNTRKQRAFEINQLKKILDVEAGKGYDNYNNFDTRILRPTVEELNTKSELRVIYEPMRDGNKVVGVLFTITDIVELEEPATKELPAPAVENGSNLEFKNMAKRLKEYSINITGTVIDQFTSDFKGLDFEATELYMAIAEAQAEAVKWFKENRGKEYKSINKITYQLFKEALAGKLVRLGYTEYRDLIKEEPQAPAETTEKKSTDTSYTASGTDYSELERRLLGWDKED